IWLEAEMPKLTLYRQHRFDGRARSGIEVEGEPQWEHFEEPPEEESDPALLWYVDVRCQGRNVPTEQCETREWLLRNAPVIRQTFETLADKLHAGYDGTWPYIFPMQSAPPGTTMKIVCSTTRGLEIGQLSTV